MYHGKETMAQKFHWISEIGYWQDADESGAKIRQLTGQISMATNIYCEDPACSKNNRIAVFRTTSPGRTPGELHIVDLNEMKSCLVDTDMTWIASFPQAYGDLYFYCRFHENKWEIRKLCFFPLEIETVHTFFQDHLPYETLGSASPCGRYLASYHTHPDDTYEVVVFDTETKNEISLVRSHEFCNPHPRFDRINGEFVLVQHNRGYRRVNGVIKKFEDTGVTLVLFSRDGKSKTILPVSRPFIPQGISGHEAWLNNKPAFIFSTSPADLPYDDGNRCGNLLIYEIGDQKPHVAAHAPETYFGHVSTSACGGYWCCDAWHWKPGDENVCAGCSPDIAVGSIKTGKFAFVCKVGGFWTGYEIVHSHPYLSADNKCVIFTSTRTGFPQVFAAMLPDGFLENLDS